MASFQSPRAIFNKSKESTDCWNCWKVNNNYKALLALHRYITYIQYISCVSLSSRFKNWSLGFPPELHPLVLGRGQVEALDFRHWFYIAEARGPTAQPTWRVSQSSRCGSPWCHSRSPPKPNSSFLHGTARSRLGMSLVKLNGLTPGWL